MKVKVAAILFILTVLSVSISLVVCLTSTVDASSLLAQCTNIRPSFPPPNTLACYRTRVQQLGPFQTCEATFVRQMPISSIADSTVNYTIYYMNSPGRLRGRTYVNRLLCRWNVQCPRNQLIYMDIVEHDIEPQRVARLFGRPVCVDYLKMFRDFGSETSCDFLGPHSELEPGRLIMEFRSNKKIRFPGFRMRIVCFNPELQGIRGCSPTISLSELGINGSLSRNKREKDYKDISKSKVWYARRTYLKPFSSLKVFKNSSLFFTTAKRHRRNAVQQQLFLEQGSTLTYKDHKLTVLSGGRIEHSIDAIASLHTYSSIEGLQSFYGNRQEVTFTGRALLTIIRNVGYYYQFGVDPKFQPSEDEQTVIRTMLESEEQLIVDQDFIIDEDTVTMATPTSTTEASPTHRGYPGSQGSTGVRGKRQSSSLNVDSRVLDAARAGADSCNAIVRAVAQSLLRLAGQQS